MSEKLESQIITSTEIANGTMSFSLQKPTGFVYRAGQTIDVAITSANGESMTHTFSLVSAPHEDTLTIATRMRDSAYKNALKSFTTGTRVHIEGPYGSFFIHSDVTKPAIFLVGGIGITPFMSMISDAAHRALEHSLYLFYSNRTPADSAFLDQLQKHASQENEHLTFIPTMTDTQETTLPWSGETGFINWDMLIKHVSNYENAIFYMAGPKNMVTAMRTMLVEHGVSEDSIRSEEFSGY